MKTQGMQHQSHAVSLMNGRQNFALFCEQGTGKTWMFLADAERLYADGKIDAMLVIAPKGTHINWVRREIPKHLEAPHIAAWYSSGASKRDMRAVDKVFSPRAEGDMPVLRILTMNIDAVNTERGFALASSFLRSTRALFVIDESQKIKNLKTARTKKVMALAPLAAVRRIGTGTPITNSPIDAFAQFEFLEHGILGTTSYYAFVAEYAELVDQASPLMRAIRERAGPRARFHELQVVARNARGEPMWRNLDKLQRLIAPHSYRVLKRDCLDLPEKIYNTHYFELPPAQRRIYDKAREELRLQLSSGDIAVFTKLTVQVKLQQITSGYANVDSRPQLIAAEENARLAAFMEFIDDIDGPFIVWARFTEELRQIEVALLKRGIACVTFQGSTTNAARQEAVDAFQDGRLRAFVGQPQSGGIGLTLTAAEHVIYFSNDWSLETRLQSEDRAHRIGTRGNVVYTDIVALNTIDETIASALQRKESVAAAVLGDFRGGDTPPRI